MVWYAIRPHDTFLIRDGRTFDTGSGAVFGSVLPRPSTIGGAIAALGGRFRYLRGPFLGDDSGEGWTLHFPLPRDVVQSGSLRPTRTHPVEGSKTLATSERLGRMLVEVDTNRRSVGLGEDQRDVAWSHNSSLISTGALERYLGTAEDIRTPVFRLSELSNLVPAERRVGIAVKDGRTQEGFLYQTTHRRPFHYTAFLADVEAKYDASTSSVPFGGAGRHAEITLAEKVGFPRRSPSYPEGNLLLYLATPGIWPRGSTPPLPNNASIVGAVIGPQEPIAAGANHQNGISKTTLRWAVPAGSVYFLKFPGEEAASKWAETHHGKALGNDLFASTGFGVILTGTWRFAR